MLSQSLRAAIITGGRSRRAARERLAQEAYAAAMAARAPAKRSSEPTGGERLHAWFWKLCPDGWKISRQPFLVLPRVLMHEMPDDWQMRFAKCLEEYAAAFPGGDDAWRVRCVSKTTGKLVETPEFYLSYLKRDGLAKVGEMRAETTP